MAKQNRVPFHVSPKFADKLKDLQKKIRMQTGMEKSLRELTDEIVSSEAYLELENKILNKKNIKMDINIKFDRRLL